MDGLNSRLPASIKWDATEEIIRETVFLLHTELYTDERIADIFDKCVYAPSPDLTLSIKIESNEAARNILNLNRLYLGGADQQAKIKKIVDDALTLYFPDRKPTLKKPAAAHVPVAIQEVKKDKGRIVLEQITDEIEPIELPKKENKNTEADAEAAARRAQEEADAELARLLSQEDSRADAFSMLSEVEKDRIVLDQHRLLENIERGNKYRTPVTERRTDYEQLMATRGDGYRWDGYNKWRIPQEEQRTKLGHLLQESQFREGFGNRFEPSYDSPDLLREDGLSAKSMGHTGWEHQQKGRKDPRKVYNRFFNYAFYGREFGYFGQTTADISLESKCILRPWTYGIKITNCRYEKWVWVRQNCDGTVLESPKDSYIRIDSNNVKITNAKGNIIIFNNCKNCVVEGSNNQVIVLDGAEVDAPAGSIIKYQDLFPVVTPEPQVSSKKLTINFLGNKVKEDFSELNGSNIFIEKGSSVELNKIENAIIHIEAEDGTAIRFAKNCTIRALEGVQSLFVSGGGNTIHLDNIKWLKLVDIEGMGENHVVNPYRAFVDRSRVTES